jgi:hypothetical protein
VSNEAGAFAPIEPMPDGPPVPVVPPPLGTQAIPAPPSFPTAPSYPPAQPAAPPGYYAPAAPPTFQAQSVPGAYPSQYAYAPVPPKGLSIASMVLGIIGVLLSFSYGLGLFPSIAAVITGHMARKRQLWAKGFSLAGLITGYVGIGISVAWIVFLIVIFSTIGSRGGFDN